MPQHLTQQLSKMFCLKSAHTLLSPCPYTVFRTAIPPCWKHCPHRHCYMGNPTGMQQEHCHSAYQFSPQVLTKNQRKSYNPLCRLGNPFKRKIPLLFIQLCLQSGAPILTEWLQPFWMSKVCPSLQQSRICPDPLSLCYCTSPQQTNFSNRYKALSSASGAVQHQLKQQKQKITWRKNPSSLKCYSRKVTPAQIHLLDCSAGAAFLNIKLN